MQCSKKSLSLLSVATIALFASLSQNSIAASNVDSWVKVCRTIPDDIGYARIHEIFSAYNRYLVGKWIAALNHVHAATKGKLGMTVEEVPQNILALLVDRGFASVKHGYVIPEITDQEYQLRKDALTNRAGGGGGGDFSSFTDSSQGQSPTGSMLSQIQGSSAVPIPTPAPNEHAPQIPAAPVVAVNNNYGTTRLIDPAKFSPELRATFDRLKANDPYMYDQVINVANYGALENDVLKGIKNPRDRMGFARAVRAANPEYDPDIAAAREQIKKDLNNPKTQFGKLGTVTASLWQADVLDATAFKNLPAGGPSFWNRCIQVPIAKFFNNTPFMVVDAQRWLFVRYLERTLMGGASLPDDIIPDDMGYEGAHRVISGYENALLGKWVASINNVHVASARRRGIPSDLVPQDILANLVDLGFVSVKHGYVIPEITAQEYEDSLKKRNQ